MLNKKNIESSPARFTKLENILNVQTIIPAGVSEQTIEINNVKFADYKVRNPSCTNFWNVNNVSDTLGNNTVSTTFFQNENNVTLSNKFWDPVYGTNLFYDANAINPNNSLLNSPNRNYSIGEPDDFKTFDNTIKATDENALNDFKKIEVTVNGSPASYTNALNLTYSSSNYGTNTGTISNVKLIETIKDTVFTNNTGRFLCIIPKEAYKNTVVIACEYEISSPDNALRPYKNRIINLLTINDVIPSYTDVKYNFYGNPENTLSTYVNTYPIRHYCVLPYCKFKLNIFVSYGGSITFNTLLGDILDFWYSPFSVDCPVYTNIYNNFYLTKECFVPYPANFQNTILEVAGTNRQRLLNGLLLPMAGYGNTITTLTGAKYKGRVDNILLWRYNAIEYLGADTQLTSNFFYGNRREVENGFGDSRGNGSFNPAQWAFLCLRDGEDLNTTFDLSKLSFQMGFYNETNRLDSEVIIDGNNDNKIMNMYCPRQPKTNANQTLTYTTSDPIQLRSTLSFSVDPANIVFGTDTINKYEMFIYDNIISFTNTPVKDFSFNDIRNRVFQFGYFSSDTSTKIPMYDYVILTFDKDIYKFTDPANFFIYSAQQRTKRSFPIRISPFEYVFCGLGTRNDYGTSEIIPINTTMYINIKVKSEFDFPFEYDFDRVTYRTLSNSYYRFKNVTKIPIGVTPQLIKQDTTKTYIIRISPINPSIPIIGNFSRNQILVSTPSNYLLSSQVSGYGANPTNILCNVGNNPQLQNLKSDNTFLLLVLDASNNIIQSYKYTKKVLQGSDTVYFFNPNQPIPATAKFEIGIISNEALSATGTLKLNNGLGANVLTIPNGWYSGLDGVNELIRLIKTIIPSSTTVTFNPFTNKLTFTTLNDGFVLNFTTKDSFDKESSARLYGFEENTSLLEVLPNTSTESPLELDPYFNNRFAFIQINLLNFANFGFLNESLGLIKIFAKNDKGTLTTTYLNQFEKILPRNSPLSNLKIEVTDGRNIKISSLENIYLDFLIECYN